MEMITHNSRFPFTSIQWQELEHQALVYKYMISGIPIPPDLLFSIKASFDSSTKLILHQHSTHQSYGWGYFHMGFGKKIDPEPGRCRRTDGKKWRCSKEAYPDSKYCERHMHRGRNRSRKPVEANLLKNSTPNATLSSSPLMCTKSSKRPTPGSHLPFVHSSRSCGGNVVSSQDRFLLESSPYSRSEKDRSYGIKDVDEPQFLSKRCGSDTISASIGDSWLLEPLTVNSSSSLAQPKQQSFSDYQDNYSYLQLQNTPTRQKRDQGHCYDQLALKHEEKDEACKVMHHFFNESPQNDNDDHNKFKDSSTTQLSISIPSCGHDFFLTRNDK